MTFGTAAQSVSGMGFGVSANLNGENGENGENGDRALHDMTRALRKKIFLPLAS